MAKVGKPRGLIDYCSLADESLEQGGAAPAAIWRRVIRPRTIIYSALWGLVGVAMVVALFLRDTIDITVRHDRNPMFVTLSDGSIRNAYEVRVQNRNGAPQPYRLSAEADGGDYLRLTVQGEDAAAVLIDADATKKLDVFLTSPADQKMTGRLPVRIWGRESRDPRAQRL